MPRAIEIVEILKTTYMISLEKSIDHYWAIYNIVKSVDHSNITDYDLEEIIGIVVTIQFLRKTMQTVLFRTELEQFKRIYQFVS